MNHLINGRVSIVVPVYNTDAAFLTECFESVKAQDYEDIELIIVDDGSTKAETGECCKSFSVGWDKCILVTIINSGVSRARAQGIEHASGSMIMFLDSDDRLEAGAVSRLVGTMKETHADAVIAQAESGRRIPHMQTYQGLDILHALLENNEAAFGWALWAKLYDTELMSRCYKAYDNIYYGEDLLVNALYFKAARSAVVIDDKLYFYRTDNPDSAMSQARSVKKLSLITMWQEMAEIYSGCGMKDETERIMANYYDSLLSGYLQCDYYRYDNYKEYMKEIKGRLKASLGEILKNKYVPCKYKYIAAVYFKWLFELKRLVTNKKQ